MQMSYYQDVLDYIRYKYSTEPEHPWFRLPEYVVFRHQDNQKVYGAIMGVQGTKLGLKTEKPVEVINVKMADLLYRDLLLTREGFSPAYHMSHGGNWVSVLLDGTVELGEIKRLLDISYLTTASAQARNAARPPKEWIIPSNLKYYDSVHAFDDVREIIWKQGAGIKQGDIVYLYAGSPVSAIMFRCLVTETDIPYTVKHESLNIKAVMKIRLLNRYAPDCFTFDTLCKEYGIHAVRGPRGISAKLSEDLEKSALPPESQTDVYTIESSKKGHIAPDGRKRCNDTYGSARYRNSEVFLAYHDTRWCKPVHDDQEIFATLCLETAAAGLSWVTILEKEENYRRVFDHFHIETVAGYGEEKVNALMRDTGIIRNRKKIESAINNAKAFMRVQKEFGSFDRYIWGFTDGQVIDHHLESGQDMPGRNELSDQISTDLKKRGFSFVGSTTVYSFLQGIGIVNDHWEYCDFR